MDWGTQGTLSYHADRQGASRGRTTRKCGTRLVRSNLAATFAYTHLFYSSERRYLRRFVLPRPIADRRAHRLERPSAMFKVRELEVHLRRQATPELVSVAASRGRAGAVQSRAQSEQREGNSRVDGYRGAVLRDELFEPPGHELLELRARKCRRRRDRKLDVNLE